MHAGERKLPAQALPVRAEDVERDRGGDWSIVLIGPEPVDRSWLTKPRRRGERGLIG
jgi:hypothetical protein